MTLVFHCAYGTEIFGRVATCKNSDAHTYHKTNNQNNGYFFHYKTPICELIIL